MNPVEVKNLRKVYGLKGVIALDGVNLVVKEGEIFGIIGPNGAGKTTLVKILLSIVRPTGGSVRLLGEVPWARFGPGNPSARARVGFLPEETNFPRFLTGEGVLRFYGGLAGMKGLALARDIKKVLKLLELDEVKKRKVKTYSRGMQQKLGICQALLGNPKMLFLDEPTSGVDPFSRRTVRDILAELRGKGVTIVMNSHLLSEIERVCDRIAIMKAGKIIRLGTLDELTSEKRTHRIRVDHMTRGVEEAITECLGLFTIEGKNCFTVDVENPEKLNMAIDRIRALEVNILEVSRAKQTLEDIYIKVVEEGEVAR